MKTIPLGTNNLVAIVDDEDFEALSQYKWHGEGGSGRGLYATRQQTIGSRKRIKVLMHREILGLPRGDGHRVEVDHRNFDTLDNRRANLRIATRSQNGARRRSARGSTSRYLGVSWHTESGRWQAGIQKNGRSINLGYFTEEREAASAYDAAARELHGVFANPNFPEVAA